MADRTVTPTPWMRSPLLPAYAFVNTGTSGCGGCAFKVGGTEMANACSDHNCLGGQWIPIDQAVALRLEASNKSLT